MTNKIETRLRANKINVGLKYKVGLGKVVKKGLKNYRPICYKNPLKMSLVIPSKAKFHGYTTYRMIGGLEAVKSIRPASNVIWSSDYITKSGKPSKQFAHSSSEELLKVVLSYDSNICEVLSDYPKRVYFDIDGKDVKLNLCDIKTVIAKYFPNQRLAVSGSYEESKTSFHIVLPDMVLNDEKDLNRMKTLAQHIKAQECEYIDDKVYTRNRIMKCIHQSKTKKRAKQEILELDDERLHFIGSFLTGNEIPLQIANEEDIISDKVSFVPIQKTKEGNVVQYNLPETFKPEQLDDARSILSLCPINADTPHDFVWKVANFSFNAGLSFDDFWSWASKKNDDASRRYKWLTYHWPKLATQDFKVSLKTMTGILCLQYPQLKNVLNKTDYITNQFFSSFDLGETTEIDTITQEHYKVPEKVIAFNMCMGGGKTTQTIQYLQEKTTQTLQYLEECNKSFAWITPRRALVMNTEGRLKSECIEVVNYLTCGDIRNKKIKEINDARNLLIQAESLHYINDTNKFDIIVIDEIESVLNGWISSTHDKNIAVNWFVFTSLLKNARRVILLDAFLTTKVKRLLNTLDIHDIKIYTSNKLPPQLIIKTSNSYDESIKNIANDLDAGRKCFVFHAFKTGNAKHLSVEALKCRLVDLCKNKIKVLVYSGDSDDKTKADLFNVNNAWAEADCIITTTAITVGVNYEGADYYKRYLFISGLCNNVRDVIQASMRIRKTVSDEVEVFFFDKLNKDTIKLPEYYHNQLNEQYIKAYKNLIDDVIIETQANFYDTFIHFCKMTNYLYDDVKRFTHNTKFENELNEARMLIAYDDIPTISYIKADDISKNRVWKGKATMIEKFELARYYFDERFSQLDEETRRFLWDNRYEKVINIISHPIIKSIETDNNCAFPDIDWEKVIISEATIALVDYEFKSTVKIPRQKLIKAINGLCGTQFITVVRPYKTSKKTIHRFCDDAETIFKAYNELNAPMDFVDE